MVAYHGVAPVKRCSIAPPPPRVRRGKRPGAWGGGPRGGILGEPRGPGGRSGFDWRGKSGLHRAGGWVTPRRREATESATETTPPMGRSLLWPQARVKRCGKSAPGSGASRDAGKPLPEQGQIEGCLRFFGGRRSTASPGRPHDSFRQREDQIDDHRPGPPGYRIRLTGPLGRPSSQPLPAVGVGHRESCPRVRGQEIRPTDS